MSVGLPGTGVGGLFYLMSALFMPFREAYRAAVGRSEARTRTVVLKQTLIALGVLGGIWLAGWVIGVLLGRLPAVATAMNALPGFTGHSSNVLKMASVLLAFSTLAAVVGAVEIASMVRWWTGRGTMGRVPDDEARLTRDAA